MSALFKQLNSTRTQTLTFNTEDVNSGNLPVKLDDGSDIPVNTFGVNVDNFDIYYWTGTEWKKSE